MQKRPSCNKCMVVRYDFTRFTHLGHRRLFRRFEEIESGAVCGPGMTLAWSYTYFLTSFTTSRILSRLFEVFAKSDVPSISNILTII